MLLGACVAAAGMAAAVDESARFEQTAVKAAFIFSFARYIDWPADRLGGADNAFIIGLSPRSAVRGELEEIAKTRSLHGRKILVREIRNVAAARDAHLLFVDRADERLLLMGLGELATGGVVTVGESDQFTEAGGMLTLYADDDRLRFRINPAATKLSDVKLSSQLMKLATATKR